MTARFPFVLHASMLFLAITGFAAEASAGQNVFSVSGSNVQVNGKPFKVIGLRLSNGLVSDAKTQELITNLDVFESYGINTFSVFFMGSRFGDVKGYLPDATIDPSTRHGWRRSLRPQTLAHGRAGGVPLLGHLDRNGWAGRMDTNAGEPGHREHRDVAENQQLPQCLPRPRQRRHVPVH